MNKTDRYMQFEARVRDILIQGTRPDKRGDVEEYFRKIAQHSYDSAREIYDTKLLKNGRDGHDVPLESIATLTRAMVLTEHSESADGRADLYLGTSRFLYDILADSAHHHDRGLIQKELAELDKFEAEAA